MASRNMLFLVPNNMIRFNELFRFKLGIKYKSENSVKSHYYNVKCEIFLIGVNKYGDS